MLTVVSIKDYPFGMSIPWDRLNFARDVTAEAKEILVSETGVKVLR